MIGARVATLGIVPGHLLRTLRPALGRRDRGNLRDFYRRLGIACRPEPREVRGAMKLPIPTLTLAFIAVLAAGCGQSSSTSAPAAGGAPAPAAPREIDLTANDTMHYDTTALTAAPGEALKVVLTNVGVTPLAAMGHNWVLLKAGSDYTAFAQAASQAKDTGYIPASLQDEIIAKIDVLGPRKSGEVDFTAPTTPGDYPFLCTFPAHFIFMHGILTVK